MNKINKIYKNIKNLLRIENYNIKRLIKLDALKCFMLVLKRVIRKR